MLHATTYASWINQIGHWFGLITQQSTCRGYSSVVKKLARKMNVFVEQYDALTSPVVWVAAAESIPTRIERLFSLVSGTRN